MTTKTTESSLQTPLLCPHPLAHTLTGSMADSLLLWAVEMGASDIVFRADDPPWIQVAGVWHPVSGTFAVSLSETQLLTNYFSGQEYKAGNVQRGLAADFGYAVQIPGERGRFQRFRVNVTSSNCGHYIVLRTLPKSLPRLEDLALEKEIEEHIYPENGIVLVSGVMGSGKSTLLAAILHSAILTKAYGGRNIGRQILTLEQPIEFDFSDIPHTARSAPVAQSEIFRHVDSWATGVRSMTRRKGEIVMVGEARDRETLQAMLSICEQGVTCYATVHAKDVPQTLTRIINTFPEEERAAVSQVLKANLRMVIHQRLVPMVRTVKGGHSEEGYATKEALCWQENLRKDRTKTVSASSDTRKEPTGEKPVQRPFSRVALREFLVFDEPLRQKLLETPLADLVSVVREAVREKGQSLVGDARQKYAVGRIDACTYAAIRDEQEGRSV